MKKIALLFVHNGSAEVDWILPVLYKLSRNYKIFTFFKSKKVYQNFKSNNEVFFLWKKINKGQYVDSLKRAFFWRIIRNIFLFIFGEKFFLNDFVFKKTNNPEFIQKILFKKFKINNGPDFIFSEFGVNSGWVPNCKSYFNNLNIIHYPSTPHVYFKSDKKHKIKFSLRGDYLLVDSALSKEYFSKQIPKKKIIVTGTPRFDKNWQKKIDSVSDFDFNYKSLSKKNSFVTFAYESYLHKFDKKIDQKLIKQLHDIMDVVSKFKNLIIIFKIHPKKNMPGYLDILKKYDKNKWIVSKNHLSKLSKISKIFLHHPFSATMLDSISLKTPTIEIWKELELHHDPLNTYEKLKLLVTAKDKKILLNLFSKILIKKNTKEFYIQYNNFKKIFFKHNKSSVNFVIKKLRILN